MDLATIAMERPVARTMFIEYRRSVRQARSKALTEAQRRQLDADEAMMRGYKTLARGQAVISLTEAFKTTGLRDSRFPRLAIARATHEQCQVDVRASEMIFTGRARSDQRFSWLSDKGGAITKYRIRVPQGHGKTWSENVTGQTIVPTVPPHLRPAHSLEGYHVLFEVARWEMIAPKDPALLKHIGGDLWAVVAIWDLTEIERLVLLGRR